MTETLEQKVNGQEHKEEEKKKDSGVVKMLKGTANVAVGAAAIGASYMLFGNTGLAITAFSPISGRIVTKLAGKDFTTQNFRNEVLAGAVTAPLLIGTLKAVTELPKYYGIDGLVSILGAQIPAYSLGIAGFTLAAIPFYTALTYPIKYLVANKTLKGLGKDFKENYLKNTAKASLYLGLPGAALVSLSATVPILAPYLIPAFLGLGITYRALMSKDKLDYKKLFNPSTYFPNPLKPFSYIAEGLGSLMRKSGKPGSKPAPALASQPAH